MRSNHAGGMIERERSEKGLFIMTVELVGPKLDFATARY